MQESAWTPAPARADRETFREFLVALVENAPTPAARARAEQMLRELDDRAVRKRTLAA
jgi:hypothetical protein